MAAGSALASPAARLAAYDFFRTPLLRSIDAALLDELYDAHGSDPDSLGGMVMQEWRRNDDSGEAGIDPEALAAEIRLEFTRLCVGPRRPKVSLYESVYRSPERLLNQAPMMQVREVYRRWGLSVEGSGLADDHLGQEMQFVFALLAMEQAAMPGDSQRAAEIREALVHFLDAHLLQWAPDLCIDALAHVTLPFWKGYFDALQALLLAERQMLEI